MSEAEGEKVALGESGPPRGTQVPPRSRAAVRQMSTALRAYLGEVNPYVDVQRLIEHKLMEHFGVIFAVQEPFVLGEDEGRTYPDRLVLELRSDVYDALAAGDPRARFTAMHEVAHLFLHQGIPLRRASRSAAQRNLPHRHYEDSEWQADAFAAEFLMPLEHVLRLPRLTAAAASVRFKVSLRAAMVRMNVLRNEGLLRMK